MLMNSGLPSQGHVEEWVKIHDQRKILKAEDQSEIDGCLMSAITKNRDSISRPM